MMEDLDDILAMADESLPEEPITSYRIPTEAELPAYWFKTQKEAFVWAMTRFVERQRAYDEVLARYKDPKMAWAKSMIQDELIEAHAWRGLIFGQDTGSGKSLPALAIAVERMVMTKRPVLWITKKGLVGNTIFEWQANRGRDHILAKMRQDQIVPLMGSPAEKEAALDRALALSGTEGTFLIANPEALLPPKAGARAARMSSRPDTADIVARLPGMGDDDEDGAEEMAGDADTQTRVYEKALALRLGLVVADEFHDYMSNNRTNLYKVLFARLEPEWRLGMSATSFPYKPRQYAMAISFFQPGLHFRSIAAFVRENFILEGDRVKHVLPGWNHKWSVLRDKTFYTARIDDVLELPPVQVHRELVDMSPSQQRAYNEATSRMVLSLEKDAARMRREGATEREIARVDMNNILVQLLRIKQICVDLRLIQKALLESASEADAWLKDISWERTEGETSPKIDRIMHAFFFEMDEFERAVVYSQWKYPCTFLCEDFARAGVKADYITGDVDSTVKMLPSGVTSERLRKTAGLNWGATEILAFNKSASEGINCQRANHIFFLDWPWGWANVAQAIGRVRRPIPPEMLDAMGGKPLPVHVHMLVAKGTIEETLLLPRLFKAARAAGIWTGGYDIAEEGEGEMAGRMFSDEIASDDESTALTRDRIVRALEG